jgi:hypothetical protein
MDNQKTDLSPHDAYLAMCASKGIDPDTMKPIKPFDGCSDEIEELKPKQRTQSKYLLPPDHPKFIYNMYVLSRMKKLTIREIKLKKHNIYRGLKKYGHLMTNEQKNSFVDHRKNEIKSLKLRLKEKTKQRVFINWRELPFDPTKVTISKAESGNGHILHDNNHRPMFHHPEFSTEYEKKYNQGLIDHAEYFMKRGVSF